MKPNFKIVRTSEFDPDDPNFFEHAYEAYFPGVYNYIRYRVWDPGAVDDLTSVTFHKALDRFSSFDPVRASFSTWLFTIARNAVNDHLRAMKRRRFLLADWWLGRSQEVADPESVMISNEQRDHLIAAIATLSPRERDFLGLKFAAGNTNRAIAGMTGESESNVGVVVHRALRKLRCRLTAGEET